jgi:hypothetical protein
MANRNRTTSTARRATAAKVTNEPLLPLWRTVRVTPTYIFGRQFNPPMVRRLPRKQWEPVYRVTGKYHRAPSQNVGGAQ